MYKNNHNPKGVEIIKLALSTLVEDTQTRKIIINWQRTKVEFNSSNPQKNARILIATYQTLNVAGENDAKFFLENYPKNYFSHIIIDECHRSAWGKWSIVLSQNPDAIQIGLTATPRSFEGGTQEERQQDEEITANNLQYFGEPVYEYDMAQGIEDGYLPAYEIIKREVNLKYRYNSAQSSYMPKPEEIVCVSEVINYG